MQHHNEMNVTPMLDVLLVLLVIFMSAAARAHRTIDAQLPTPCPGTCEGGGSPIVLEVLPGPTFRLNRNAVAPEELARRLHALYAARREKILLVAGHPGVSYQHVVTAMDVARSAGVRVIGVPGREMYLQR